MQRTRSRLTSIGLGLFLAAGTSFANTVETIFTAPDPGVNPFYTVTETPAGNFLTSSFTGGPVGFGSIAQVTPGGQTSALVSFIGENGTFPDSPLTPDGNGKYLGVTSGGGKNDQGVVFRISAAGEYEKLADLANIGGAAGRGRLLLASDGNVYGCCVDADGSHAGTIFKLTPDKKLTVLAQFPLSGQDAPNGRFPMGDLVEHQDGSFLGVASRGGANDAGTVFKVTKTGTMTKVTDFNGTNGYRPEFGFRAASDGAFYGVASGGAPGGGPGVVYKLSAAGEFSVIADFFGFDLESPSGQLVEVAGSLFGAARFGGPNNHGGVFKVTISEPTPQLSKVVELTPELGSQPYGGLTRGSDGHLYGTTPRGGAGDTGTLFRCTTAGTLTKVADYAAPKGQDLTVGLTLAPNGSLYGVANQGGAKGSGTIFTVDPVGEVTKIADLDGGVHGIGFGGPLVVKEGASAPEFQLLATTGGINRLLSASPAGVLSVLEDLGQTYHNGLMKASNDVFYSTSFSTVAGSIFSYSLGGDVQQVLSFPAEQSALQPRVPRSTLVEAPDGSLWGTTEAGGSRNLGTIFRLKNGQYSVVASFTGENGARPRGPLLRAKDGNFYGLASGGGINNLGTVFRVTPQGKLTRLAAFNGFNGAFPAGGLIQGVGNQLFGMALTGGGPGKVGTVFKVSLDGRITLLQTFDGKTNGGYPRGSLVRGPDGHLYGTTYSTIFRVTMVNNPPVAKNDSFTLPVIRKNLLSNDSDPDKDTLQIIAVTNPTHGSVELNEDGTVSYLPAPDFDTETVTTDTFTYTIADGQGGQSTATVTVNVPPDLIRASAGVYGGVIAKDNSPQGYWLLTTAGPGIFTGVIYLDGNKTSIKGAFNADGTYTTTKTRKVPLPSLVINLQLDPLTNAVGGTITAGTDTYTVALLRNLPIYSAKQPTSKAGRYTALIRGGVSSSLPGGTGFAAMTVTPRGAVAMVGKLGDGEPFAVGSFLAATDEVPIYAGLYKSDRGYLAGLLRFEDHPDSDIEGAPLWKKPAQSTDALYPAGFETGVLFQGARYTPQTPTIPVPTAAAGVPNATLTLGANPPKNLHVPITPKARFGIVGDPSTVVTLNATTGIFIGTHRLAGPKLPLAGAIYQKTGTGEGFFRTGSSTGKVLIEPAP